MLKGQAAVEQSRQLGCLLASWILGISLCGTFGLSITFCLLVSGIATLPSGGFANTATLIALWYIPSCMAMFLIGLVQALALMNFTKDHTFPILSLPLLNALATGGLLLIASVIVSGRYPYSDGN